MSATVVPCTGDGIGVDENGGVTVYGPREQKWKATGAECDIDKVNGTRVDPDTHKLWTAPDATITWTQHGVSPAIAYDVYQVGTHVYTPYKVHLTSKLCARTYVSAHLTDGFSAFFCSPGNYWVHRCNIKATIDGVGTHNSSAPAAFICPTATTWTGFGHPAWLMSRIIGPGQTLEVTVSYFLDILAYAAGPSTNSADIRLPNLNLSMWSFPL